MIKMSDSEKLIQLFVNPTDINSSKYDFQREMILAHLDSESITSWACKGNDTVVNTDKGWFLIHLPEQHKDILVITFLPIGQFKSYQFWMNKSSMSDLGNTLRSLSHLRKSLNDVFFQRSTQNESFDTPIGDRYEDLSEIE